MILNNSQKLLAGILKGQSLQFRPGLIPAQDTAFFIPVSQYDPFGWRTVSLKLVYSRPVGMAVKHDVDSMLLKRVFNSCRIYIHDFGWFENNV